MYACTHVCVCLYVSACVCVCVCARMCVHTLHTTCTTAHDSHHHTLTSAVALTLEGHRPSEHGAQPVHKKTPAPALSTPSSSLHTHTYEVSAPNLIPQRPICTFSEL